jgi:hypothetical protein
MYKVLMTVTLEITLILIYLLTTIVLTPGGSSTVHIYTQKITQNNTINLGRVRAVPRFAS